jgi:hypothetical protein
VKSATAVDIASLLGGRGEEKRKCLEERKGRLVKCSESRRGREEKERNSASKFKMKNTECEKQKQT